MPKRNKKDKLKAFTVEEVKKWPMVDRLVIRREDQEEKIVKGDCIFAAHKGVDLKNRRKDGHIYWKARVDSIHKKIPVELDAEKQKYFLVVAWFYSCSDVKKGVNDISLEHISMLDNYLGNAEIIASNHLDVIDAECIEAKASVHLFNDKKFREQAFATDSWFCQLELTLDGETANLEDLPKHCICQSPYSPVTSTQRYCRSCHAWFDVDCIARNPSKTFRGPLSKKVASMPVMRGDLGDGSDRWKIVGSGRKVDRMKKWIKNDALPQSWKDILGIDFVQYVEHTAFLFYVFPFCDQDI